jgi:hypothetical protein
VAAEKWEEFIPASIRVDAPFKVRADEYLKKRGLKYTLRKNSEGRHVYEFTKDSAKKGILLGLEEERSASGARILIKPGKKFLPAEFSEEVLSASAGSQWVRAQWDVPSAAVISLTP